jgi:hypothetical protein
MSDEENAALAIKTGIEQMFVPLRELLDKLLGKAATEVGLALGRSCRLNLHTFTEQQSKDSKFKC